MFLPRHNGNEPLFVYLMADWRTGERLPVAGSADASVGVAPLDIVR